MAEGTNNQNQTTTTTQTAAGAGDKTFTQADVDRVVADRLERERKKYAGFEDYKKAKEELDALKAGQMSELEKAKADLEKAQKEAKESADKIKALELTALKSKLASEAGLPAELAAQMRLMASEPQWGVALNRAALEKSLRAGRPDLSGNARICFVAPRWAVVHLADSSLLLRWRPEAADFGCTELDRTKR